MFEQAARAWLRSQGVVKIDRIVVKEEASTGVLFRVDGWESVIGPPVQFSRDVSVQRTSAGLEGAWESQF
jgi:hypothetical protein